MSAVSLRSMRWDGCPSNHNQPDCGSFLSVRLEMESTAIRYKKHGSNCEFCALFHINKFSFWLIDRQAFSPQLANFFSMADSTKHYRNHFFRALNLLYSALETGRMGLCFVRRVANWPLAWCNWAPLLVAKWVMATMGVQMVESLGI